MRPISKGASPVVGDFRKYQDAKPDLVSRLGLYCSYCERRIVTLLAVEHIEPKSGPNGRPRLEKCWNNFLLACTNCNSCKGPKAVNFEQLLFPDRDNTFAAFVYKDDGTTTISPNITPHQTVIASNLLRLVGLKKPVQIYNDSNEQLVALDRSGQRMQAIACAKEALSLLQAEPDSNSTKEAIVMMAVQAGYFSIWMKVFDAHIDMKVRFIQAFNGTLASGCFDMTTGDSISPAPNPDALTAGSKV
jgi:hypothetical protein